MLSTRTTGSEVVDVTPSPPAVARSSGEHTAASGRAGARRVAVVGLGYVGLPLVVDLLAAGFVVRGVDVDPARLRHVAQEPVLESAVRERRLTLAGDAGNVGAHADVVVVCVPTPWDHEVRAPDLRAVLSAASEIARGLQPGTLVVLESTTYPGTTEGVFARALEEGSGLRAGVDFHLAYSPERVDPGNVDFGIANTPKVVGGVTPACTRQAVAFYERFVGRVVAAAGTREAELAKLIENTYRLVNVALVNEIAVACHELQIDVWDALECAATKPFGYAPFRPGPGVGGHCIPIDPLYLSHLTETELGRPVAMVETATRINRSMPLHLAARAAKMLGGDVAGRSVLLVGVAYKADVHDTRETPAEPLAAELRAAGADVAYLDPLVEALDVGGRRVPRAHADEIATAGFDLVILLQHHSSVDIDALCGLGVPVLDARGQQRGANVERL
ncbi:nucleotide sugar dehydrogenase [Cellulomonas fimi]|uniref:nucleotide sugar dehydrogenase n=1 Tax=Cellulomonas fimi TaxID=1708 RepID=UPI00235A447E|nr:nucleotide sugar dehydrogenase [Cellulomonas fimi]